MEFAEALAGTGHRGVGEILRSGRRSFSFEFFPPKTDEGEDALWRTIGTLTDLRPTFVSVTYGAGGTTRDRTVRITGRIAAETGLLPVGHLTCVGHSVAELRAVLAAYAAAGIHNVLALRGDPPGDPRGAWTAHPDGLDHAEQLVRLVRETGDFCVGVAAFPEGHPDAPDLEADAAVLAAKFAAGAEYAITQFFFDADDYFRLRDRVARHTRGTADAPIIPGVMPVTNVGQIERFAQLSGAAFPARLAERLQAVAEDPAAVRAIGVEVATALAERLLEGGAPGLHFITLNRSRSTREVYRRLECAGRINPDGADAGPPGAQSSS